MQTPSKDTVCIEEGSSFYSYKQSKMSFEPLGESEQADLLAKTLNELPQSIRREIDLVYSSESDDDDCAEYVVIRSNELHGNTGTMPPVQGRTVSTNVVSPTYCPWPSFTADRDGLGRQHTGRIYERNSSQDTTWIGGYNVRLPGGIYFVEKDYTIYEKSTAIPKPGEHAYDRFTSYAHNFNNWLFRMDAKQHEQYTKHIKHYGDLSEWRYATTVTSVHGYIAVECCSSSLMKVKNLVYSIVMMLLQRFFPKECDQGRVPGVTMPHTQAGEDQVIEGDQGAIHQESEKSANTIITRDEAGEKTIVPTVVSSHRLASSEETMTFDSITKRWMPLEEVVVSTTDRVRSVLKLWELPYDLFKMIPDSVNLIPFQNFVYSNLDLEIKFVVNANKFQCGKILVSVRFDVGRDMAAELNLSSYLSRPHAFIDMSANNEVTLKVPFRYHRSFIRNVRSDDNTVGVIVSKQVVIEMTTLSQLQTGKDGPVVAHIRPYVRFTRAEFAGIAPRATVQMGLVADVIDILPLKGVKEVISEAEQLIDALSSVGNRDKPMDNTMMTVVPRVRQNFCSGKGLSDAIPLCNNPYTATNYTTVRPFPDDPISILDIAGAFGLYKAATWKSSDKAGSTIVDFICDPSCREYGAKNVSNFTPLEVATSFYAFWAGTIDVRVDFISNQFHTGSVMLAVEYNRPVKEATEKFTATASTYTKVFHLGDQKTVDFKIPYIYDTVMRRSCAMPWHPFVTGSQVPSSSDMWAVYAPVSTRFRIRIVNELVPIASAPQQIEVLVYWKAGEDFNLHSLKMPSLNDSAPWNNNIDDFPTNYAEFPVPKLPRVQMDQGDAEDEDVTENFRSGRPALPALTTDDQTTIKDILRRPSILVDNTKLSGFTVPASNGSSMWIPLMPPSAALNNEGGNAIYSPNAAVTPQAKIVNLYRYFRGRQRLTVIVHGDVRDPVYVTAVPHTGSRIIGNKAVVTHDLPYTRRHPIYSCGLATDFIMTSVNPTACFEFPFDTEVDWALCCEWHRNDNYEWRDKGDYNVGHAVITCAVDCNVSVWWSAGDDFELANYWGPINSSQNDTLYMRSDRMVTTTTLLNPVDQRTKLIGVPIGTPRVEDPLENKVDDATVKVVNSPGSTFQRTTTPKTQMTTDVPEEEAIIRTQMMRSDFSALNGASLGSTINAVKNVLPGAVLMQVPLVGPVYGAAKALGAVQTLEKTANSLTESSERIADRVDDVTTSLIPLIEVCEAKLTTLIDTLYGGVKFAFDIMSVVRDVAIDIAVSVASGSWAVLASTFVRLLARVLDINFKETLQSFVSLFSSVFSRMFSGAEVQMMTESTLAATLCSIVGGLFHVALSPTRYENYFAHVLHCVVDTKTSMIIYVNHIFRFISSTFECVKAMIMEALGYANVETRALKMLGENSEEIRKFVSDSQKILSGANTNMMLHPTFRLQFWSLVIRAHTFQQALTAAPNNVAAPVLARVCSDVIRVSNEKLIDASCSPVRFEPYVICLVGPPDAGKSFFTEHLASKLMDAIGFNRLSAGLTYTRTPGSKFWTGYRDQPVIVYDDWLNLNDSESIIQQLRELYQLKSTCDFIPDMAHLDEKKIRANPLVVVLLCNDAFPNTIDNHAFHKDAVFRRRNEVFEVTRKREYIDVELRTLPEEVSRVSGHLAFRRHRCPRDESRGYYSGVRTSEETTAWLADEFVRYHAQETVFVRRRYAALQSRLQGVEIDENTLRDPFEVLYGIQNDMLFDQDISSTAWYPSELLTNAVDEIINTLRERDLPPAIVIPQRGANIFAEAPIDIYDFIKGAAVGCLLTPHMWRDITSVAASAFEVVFTKFSGPLMPVGECVICKEIVPCLAACRGSLGLEAPHYVCAPCRARWTQRSCPMCRSDDMVLLLTEATSGLYTWILWLMKKGMDSCTAVSEVIGRYAKVLPVRLNAMVLGFTKVILLAMGADVDMYSIGLCSGMFAVASRDPDFFSFVLMSSGVDEVNGVTTFEAPDPQVAENRLDEYIDDVRAAPRPGLWNWMFGAQMDRGVESDTREEWISEAGGSGVPGETMVREDLLAGFVIDYDPDPLPDCHHADIMNFPERVLGYFSEPERKWRLQIDGGVLFVPDRPCGVDCPFADVDRVRAFIHAHAEAKKIVYRRDLIAYQNDVRVRDLVKSRIPFLVRPHWIEAVYTPEVSPMWWDYLVGVYERWRAVIWACAGIVTVAGCVLKFSGLFGVVAPRVQAYERGGEFIHRVTRNVNIHPSGVRVQGPDLHNAVREKIVRNYATLVMRQGSTERRLGMIGVVGKFALIPKHYMSVLRDYHENEGKFWVEPTRYSGGLHRIDYRFDEGDFTLLDHTDLAVFRLPDSYPMFRDIRKHFIMDEDLTRLNSDGEIVAIPTRSRNTIVSQRVQLRKLLPLVTVSDVKGLLETRDVVQYDYSEDGVCGSLVFQYANQRPILSMHTAGTGFNEGYGVLITQELLAELLPRVLVCEMEHVELESVLVSDRTFWMKDESHVEYMGVLPKELAPHTPKKSKIVPSAIQGVGGLEPFTEPVILHKGDTRYELEDSPLKLGVEKHGVLTSNFRSSWVSEASNALYERVFQGMRPAVVDPVRLSAEQAVVGIPGVEFYDAMKLNTSAGWPWSVRSPDTTKKRWIRPIRSASDMMVDCVLDPELKGELDRKEKLRRSGVQPCTVFVDTLKDERKVKAKIRRPGATRVFCSSPLDYTIAMRQNLLHFCASFMKNRVHNMSAVGMNVKGIEWTGLFHYLTQFGHTRVVGLDYSNFGPGFNATVAHAAADIMVRWTMEHVGDVDETELSVLLAECYNSVHCVAGTVYQQFSGSPSGASITTVINSLVNMLYVMVAWRQLTPGGLDPWETFFEKVALVVYGDDLIMSVDSAFEHMFNAVSIRDWFAQYGIVSTGSDKDAELMPSVDIREATFLKRGFLAHPKRRGLWLSPLAWESVNDATQWIWKTGTVGPDTRVNAASALIEAHSWGEKRFNEFKAQVNLALIGQRIDPLTLDWDNLDAQWFEGKLDDYQTAFQ